MSKSSDLRWRRRTPSTVSRQSLQIAVTRVYRQVHASRLGHAAITTTSRYLQSTPLRLERALARLEEAEGFSPTPITAHLGNGGTVKRAQAIAAHASPRTTRLSARRTMRG